MKILKINECIFFKNKQDFPGGAAFSNLSVSAGDMGSVSSQENSLPQSK